MVAWKTSRPTKRIEILDDGAKLAMFEIVGVVMCVMQKYLCIYRHISLKGIIRISCWKSKGGGSLHVHEDEKIINARLSFPRCVHCLILFFL